MKNMPIDGDESLLNRLKGRETSVDVLKYDKQIVIETYSEFNFDCTRADAKVWDKEENDHFFDLYSIFISFGINPDSFKKKRHAKKFFKKYLRPLLLKGNE